MIGKEQTKGKMAPNYFPPGDGWREKNASRGAGRNLSLTGCRRRRGGVGPKGRRKGRSARPKHRGKKRKGEKEAGKRVWQSGEVSTRERTNAILVLMDETEETRLSNIGEKWREISDTRKSSIPGAIGMPLFLIKGSFLVSH